MTTTQTTGSRGYLALLAGGAALGGFLFGYDTAVISGAIGYLKEHFHLAADMTGWAASSLLVGAMVGALFGGPLSDRFGRKPMLMACAVIFALSGIGSAVAQDMAVYSWSRLFGGLGIGAVSVLSPPYVAEVAPERSRGRLVALYQFALVVGILLSFFVNMLIQRYGLSQPPAGAESWNVAQGWRWMLGMLTVPAVIFWCVVLPLPESPRWLMKRGMRAKAQAILERVGGAEAAAKEMAQIDLSLQEEEGRFSELFHGGYGRAMFIGTMLAIFSQFGGINSIMYYGPLLFTTAGSGESQAFASTVVLGCTNVASTFIGIALVDRLGRKMLLIGGVALQTFALVTVGILYHIHASPLLLLVFVVIYLVGFSSSTGIVTWVIISEIFPTKLRGLAMGIAVLALWGADYIVSQTFPMLKEAIGPSNTFFCYAICCFTGLLFTIWMVPETKGRTLEEIEQSWHVQKSSSNMKRGLKNSEVVSGKKSS
jgi:SP family arabinose:H+ symporter-like MFS transporter